MNKLLSVMQALIVVLCITSKIPAQTQTPAATEAQTHEQVARALADTGRVVILGTNKLEVKISEQDRKFQFAEGESRAILVKLPDYTKPYELQIASGGKGFMTI